MIFGVVGLMDICKLWGDVFLDVLEGFMKEWFLEV